MRTTTKGAGTFVVVQKRISPNYKRRHQAQPTFRDPKSKPNRAFQPPLIPGGRFLLNIVAS